MNQSANQPRRLGAGLRTKVLIVMEIGGFLAHGAIVARKYGVPAAVNIPGVSTQGIKPVPLKLKYKQRVILK